MWQGSADMSKHYLTLYVPGRAPLGGHPPNAAEHGLSYTLCSIMYYAIDHLQYAACALDIKSASDVPSRALERKRLGQN